MLFVLHVFKKFDRHVRHSRDRVRSLGRGLAAAACYAMYAMALVHWVLTLRALFVDNSNSATSQDELAECLANAANGDQCALTPEDLANLFGPHFQYCANTGLLIVSVRVRWPLSCSLLTSNCR